MDKKEEVLQFLLKARTQTYAGAGGTVKAVLADSKQLEYREEDWFYRDIYYIGNGIFMGLEVVHFQDKPIFATSYYGNFKEMTEEEIDKVLRKALIDNSQTARIWKRVEWREDEYEYICQPDFEGSIEEFAGTEKISKNGKAMYSFFYAGGLIG